MKFIHIKIFDKSIDADTMSKSIGLTPSFVYRAGESIGKKDSWIYTVELDDDADVNESIKVLVYSLYEKRAYFNEYVLRNREAELYFVIAYYVDSHQGIISLKNEDIAKIYEMGFDLVVDIMSP